MIQFDSEKIKEILIKEEKYVPQMADSVLGMLQQIDSTFQEALNQWRDNRSIIHLEIEGFSIVDVMKKRKCNFINALLFLNLLQKEPDRIKRLLEASVLIR